MSLLFSFFTLITFLIGFFLGRYTLGSTEVKKFVHRIRRPKLGAVRRPTAEGLRKKGTVEEQTENAMARTFNKILK